MEVWKDIDDSYEVSSYGRIRSKDRKITRPYRNGFRTMRRKGVIKKLVESCDGYLRVKLYGKYVSVSHLVAKAFISNPNGYTVVHHKDHNHQNNHVENLEWATKEEHDKLHAVEKTQKVYQYNMNGRLIHIYESQQACVKDGFNQGHVSDCCLGKRHTHKGYIWKYNPMN